MSDDEELHAAVKPVNEAVERNGLVQTLMVYGALTRIGLSKEKKLRPELSRVKYLSAKQRKKCPVTSRRSK